MPSKLNSIDKHAIGLLALLGIEFLLGVWASLFAEFPDNSNANQLWSYGFTQWSVVAHIIVGLLILAGAVALLVSAYKRKSHNWKVAGWAGFAFVTIAFICGERFVTTQNDWFSLIMSVGLAGVAGAYIYGLLNNRTTGTKQ